MGEFFTNIPTRARVQAATINLPLQELDNAIKLARNGYRTPAEFGDVSNPLDDHTLIWQNFIASAADQDKALFVPYGILNIEEGATIPNVDYVTIHGVKGGRVVWQNAFAGNVLLHATSFVIKQLVIGGWTVDGNHDICTHIPDNYELFRIAQVDGCWIYDMTMHHSPGNCMYVAGGGSGFGSARVFITSCDLYAIGAPNSPLVEVTPDVYQDIFDGASVEAISCPPNSEELIEINYIGNHVHDEVRADVGGGCTGYSIEANSLGAAYCVNFIGNTARNIRSNGFKIGPGCVGFTMTGNTFDGVGTADFASSLTGAIIIKDSTDGVIASNVIINNFQQGVALIGCERVVAIGNKVNADGNAAAFVVRNNAADVVIIKNAITLNANSKSSCRGVLIGVSDGASVGDVLLERVYTIGNFIHNAAGTPTGNLIEIQGSTASDSITVDEPMIARNVLSSVAAIEGVKVGNTSAITNVWLEDNFRGLNVNNPNLGASATYRAIFGKSRNGNLLIGGINEPSSMKGGLVIATTTAPTGSMSADAIALYSSDSTAAGAGNTIPSWYCEGTGVLLTGQADSVSSRRVRMRFNGSEVTLLAI